jgi:hypothetical protein
MKERLGTEASSFSLGAATPLKIERHPPHALFTALLLPNQNEVVQDASP